MAQLPAGSERSASSRCYTQGEYLNGGETWVVKGSGAVTIVVFSLANRTRKAVGVHCNPGGCSVTMPPKEPVGAPIS